MSGLARNQADQLFGAGISETPTVRADISGHDRAMPRRAGIIRRNEITAVLASGFAARMILILHDGFLSLPGCRRSTGDRKSTRLNSSHVSISYAVFCLKKKKKLQKDT